MADSDERAPRLDEVDTVRREAPEGSRAVDEGPANSTGDGDGLPRTTPPNALEAGLETSASPIAIRDEEVSREKKRKSDDISRSAQGERHFDETGKAVAGQEHSKSYRAAASSTGLHGLPQHERSLSPQARARGLSLRSSLLFRNTRRKDTANATTIEMQGIPPTLDGTGSFSDPSKAAEGSATITVSTSRGHLGKTRPSPTSFRRARKTAATLQGYRTRWMPTHHVSKAYTAARKFILRIKDILPSEDGRHIPIDSSRQTTLIDARTGHAYIDNFIKSSKYTIWNFLPRQLFAQFSKLANFYFLTVSILQMIPGLSTTGRYTTFAPLMFFVSLSMGKEGYEDLRRHRLDKAENNRMVNVLSCLATETGPDGKDDPEHVQSSAHLPKWSPVKWQSLHVGDIVKLERDQPCPADILLLDSKGEQNVACIETMALDGETNLKNKQPPASLIGKCNTLADISALGADVTVEDPNLDLYNFEGKISLRCDGSATPLTNNEVIYRGSVLRNTPEAIGLVIYSGEECKIRMNANKNPRIKAPMLQSIVNKIVVMMVFFVLILSFSQAIAYQFWNDFEDRAWYLTDARVSFGPLITSFILMFNTLIPLSLYISLEIVKVGQIVMMQDIDMYDEASDTPFEAHTSTINEELGQVSYVFSDKTGTLTDNVMFFRKLSVAGTAWLHDLDLKKQSVEDDVLLQLERSDGKGKQSLRRVSRRSTSRIWNPPSASQTPRRSIASWRSSAAVNIGQPELDTTAMVRYIQRRPHTGFARKASMMILAMALCHTCVPEHGETEDDISYQASSPDELALVEAARMLGYIAFHREMSTITLRTYPHGLSGECVQRDYQILDVIEFSSQRKRMSVVVRFPEGQVCVISKGADSVIMERLRLADLARQTVAEIERRVSDRRNLGAQQALERKSMGTDRRTSVLSNPRTGMAAPRTSRSSMGRLALVGDNVDGWLTDRESEPTTPAEHSHYSPRPSAQLARHSSPFPSGRSSYQQDYREEDLVDETLVLNDAAVIERCFQHVNDFATEGLRTLLYGHRFLDEEEYQSWKKIYSDATTSLVDRQKKVEEAGELIERTLELTGATAIEDKLQTGVPDTIDRLRRARIKMWMLTGDKRETAINIGHSCRLIKDYSSLTILDHVAGSVEQSIASAITDIRRGTIAHSVIIIDGQTLGTIQADVPLHTLFLDLAILADSVICCRASPSQKASLVTAIRHRVPKSVTLAIGDGANDIAMIQEAHVGIGITGKEGLQAARVSDYSIARFRFLAKLLLVHGRWNYVRTCKYVAGTFWKELLFYLTQALFQRSDGYTGTSLYEQWSLSMFNTLFTSLPVIFLGIFERDLAASTLIAVPELYTKGQRSAGFNFTVYFAWMFTAACESCVAYFVMLGLYGRALFTTGQDLFSMGVLTYSVCVVVINAKLQLIEQRYKTTLALACVVIEVGGWFLWNVIFNFTYEDNNEKMVADGFVQRFGRNALWWLALILGVAACVLFELGVRATKCAFWSTDVEVFQQLEKDPAAKARFEEAATEVLRQGWVLQKRGEAGKAGVEMEGQAVGGKDRDGEVAVDVHEVFARRFGRVKR